MLANVMLLAVLDKICSLVGDTSAIMTTQRGHMVLPSSAQVPDSIYEYLLTVDISKRVVH